MVVLSSSATLNWARLSPVCQDASASLSERRQTNKRSAPPGALSKHYTSRPAVPPWNLSKQCSHQSNTTLHNNLQHNSPIPQAVHMDDRSFDKAINIFVYVGISCMYVYRFVCMRIDLYVYLCMSWSNSEILKIHLGIT